MEALASAASAPFIEPSHVCENSEKTRANSMGTGGSCSDGLPRRLRRPFATAAGFTAVGVGSVTGAPGASGAPAVASVA